MGSQFVDFNADGHLDYLTATFDGSPHVAYGSAQGFDKPVRLKDTQGRRLLICSIWDYEKEQHIDHAWATPDGKANGERCISAVAFDWDADGDYDLLLGSYENGRLYRQMNEGTNKEPKFSGKNIAVLAGDAAFALPAKMTAPRLVDWDRDGDLDLIVGSFGNSWTQASTGGGVYLSRNNGKKGAPAFGALETLLAPARNSEKGADAPSAGLYADAVDYDGDGDLDLVVGGYSLWQPEAPPLSNAEQAEVADLRAKLAKLSQESNALMQKIHAETKKAAPNLKPGTPEYRKQWSKFFEQSRGEYNRINSETRKRTAALQKLVPGPKREACVWLYERQ